MNKGILKITNEALKNILKIDQDIHISGVSLDINRDIVELAVKTENKDKLFIVTEGASIPTVTLEEVTQNDCLYTIKSSRLSYSGALKALKEGKCIARSIWKGFWKLEAIEGLDRMTIVAYLKGDGTKVTATAYQEDMLAEDWYIVESKNIKLIPKPKVIVTNHHKDIPFHSKELLVNAFDKNKGDFILFEGMEKIKGFSPRTFNYLLSRGIVEIPSFAEGQAECVRLTDIGAEVIDHFRHVVASCL